MTGLDEPWLRQELECLEKEIQVSFALLLCQRMTPALQKFSSETGFDSSFYRDGLDSVWHYLTKHESSSYYGQLAEQCVDNAPDTEDYSHPLASAALNAALSIAATLRFLADDEVGHVVEVAGLARDTAALHAQTIDTTPPHSLSIDEIRKHSLVQHELRQQAKDLEFVKGLPADDSQRVIAALKSRVAGTQGVLPPQTGQ